MYEVGKLSHLLSPVNGEGGGGLPTAQRPDPFTLESLIAWLRTKDADETYSSVSITNCLLCQYLSAVRGTPQGWAAVCATGIEKIPAFDVVAHHDGRPQNFTYASALSRALAYQAGAK